MEPINEPLIGILKIVRKVNWDQVINNKVDLDAQASDILQVVLAINYISVKIKGQEDITCTRDNLYIFVGPNTIWYGDINH